jgi:hypothetical protein
MDLQELLALIEQLGELTDEQIVELIDNLRTAADDRLDGDLDDAVLAELEQIATAIEAARGEEATRAEADTERAAAAQALADRIRGEASDDGDDEGGDDENADAAGDDENADADASSDDENADENADAESTDEPVEADAEKETVSASAPPARPSPRIGRVAARRPSAVAPRQRQPERALTLTASANVPGMTAGERLDSPDKVIEAFANVLRASGNYRGPRVQMPVMTIGDDPRELYGAERTLGRDPVVNDERIRALTSPQAVTAAGGICAPAPVRYDFPTIGTDARPVRDGMMARFGADRGGVRLFDPVTFSDVDDGVGTWTNANDINPSDPATKPCVVMTCADDDEAIVYAVTRCLEVGNFRARFFGEQVQEWLKKLGEWHARYAETKLLTAIGSGSTQVVTGTVLGTSRDVLTSLDRAIAGYVSRHRADPGQRLRFGAPFWLRNMIRTDLAREVPGSSDERLATADATIDSFFAARNINPSWFLDGESGQIFGPQPDAALVAWPSTVVTYLYAEGDWLFLDGGTLDLGLVRDSSLNSTNDAQFFSETFEGAAFHGIESLRITMDVCPDGSTSAPIDINPCTTGS